MKFFLLFIISISLLWGGCYPLRKKFVKKKPRRKPPVYLNLGENSPSFCKEVYLDCYLFIRGWLSEVIDELREGGNVKREKRAIDEVLHNLEVLKSFFNQEGKQKLMQFYKKVEEIKKEIESKLILSEVERLVIRRKVEIMEREFERNFNWRATQQWRE